MPSRTLVCKDGLIITNPIAIAGKLLDHHLKCISENTSVQPGGFGPVVWNKPFTEEDEVLEISNDLVANCIGKLKNTAVPDNILPSVIKLLFGRPDSVQPMGDMIRAVAKTRLFPTDGKVSKQVFIWKGKGLRNILENNRPITMASIPLMLAELCVKSSARLLWSTFGFPRDYWGHFFGAPESIYVWMSTVEKYIRRGCRPITLLTDVSKAFDRVHLELYRRKLFDFGIPRQLQELILEFLSGLRVSLCWGKVKTQLLDRGNIGTPQGSLEGMWNFGVYSDNISSAIAQAVPGIEVGGCYRQRSWVCR